MIILGIGGVYHDSAAALLRDGRLVAAVEEERFTRSKHEGGYPKNSVRYCLEEAGIEFGDVDHVAFFMNFGSFVRSNTMYHLRRIPGAPKFHFYRIFKEIDPMINPIRELQKLSDARGRPKIHYVDHHISHAASSFFASPFESAAFLSLDQRGEKAATMTGAAKGLSISRMDVVDYPHSLGMVYSLVTDFLGFKPNNDEYKVMGLASYGEPRFADTFKKIINLTGDGLYKLDLSYFGYHQGPEPFTEKFHEVFGERRAPESELTQKHKDIAASLQQRLEETGIHLARRLAEKTKEKNLCLAGGVALNSVMNGKLITETPFEQIYIQPAAGDAGTALGCALHVQHAVLKQPREFVMEHAFWGPSYSDEEIEREIKMCKLPYDKLDNPAKRAAELIAKGNIIGWFQGRMEWGPRALGARSILADPTNPEMKDTVNRWVKFREDFRPFAPSILAEETRNYFKIPFESPYMLYVVDVVEDKKEKIPAVTHVDGTARLHSVRRDGSPLYYDLISEFGKITGVPVVLNTSFNVRGEPIVRTPRDAMRCFFSNGMDHLIIGSFHLSKEKIK